MKVQNTRLFIKNLGNNIKEDDLRSKFSNYGTVTSVEVKERKNAVGNQTPYFAYINLDAESKILQNCIEDLSNTKWKGYYLDLQVAKESFIERLKRERDEVKTQTTFNHSSLNSVTKNSNVCISNNANKTKFDSSSEDENKAETSCLNYKIGKNVVCTSKEGAKINTEHEPEITIVKVPQAKRKLDDHEDANAKRLQSLKQMKDGYRKQKQLIKNALSNIDGKKNNKIVFGDYDTKNAKNDTSNLTKTNQKVALFEDDEEDNLNYNIEVHDKLEGLKGQKLMQLQSHYKNDDRFKLDSRFLDDSDEDDKTVDINEEKEKQMEILESVLGQKIKRNSTMKNLYPSKQPTNMLRFDPSQPGHSQYEVKSFQNDNLKQSKKQKSTVKLIELPPPPEVSKETFYNVEDDFKKTLYGTQEFSLSKLFNKVYKGDVEDTEKHLERPISIKKTQEYDANPFQYDSSDDDGKEENVNSEPIVERSEKIQVKPRLWTETFFFKEDDYRLQEGFDFIKRLQVDEQENFQTVRRNLKEIIKAKVKNNLRKNRPFKRKLGGGNKKRFKIKKALKH